MFDNTAQVLLLVTPFLIYEYRLIRIKNSSFEYSLTDKGLYTFALLGIFFLVLSMLAGLNFWIALLFGLAWGENILWIIMRPGRILFEKKANYGNN
jgi:hypothetical protein